jgi:hypothetical protein
MRVTTRGSSVHKRAWLRPIIARQARMPSEITIGARNAASEDSYREHHESGMMLRFLGGR